MYTPAQMRAVMRRGILMVQKQQQRISSTSFGAQGAARRQRQKAQQILPTKKGPSSGAVDVAAGGVQEMLRCIQRDVAYLRRHCDMTLAAKAQQEHAPMSPPKGFSHTTKVAPTVPHPMTPKKRQPPARKVSSKHVDLDFLHDL
mmetsp:Transcript_60086/g.69604  ORF Transcript_60086/g.69604 Transcript_60086/m.69604 type:complete len:144 (+) Transcript_60086:73-504(+)|eukprot:CAMPEP_0176438546 /NCGR_PEP_ID=MMETSP0127-20121128/19356_1 /TAXON_ID=938130 /ORGANISM="Platyophrya macrostoma, Strain WH" /LENGTH=143 /DNA_ID=CAMNT_0017822533 /DNA_START=6 /DNA_END=437 /DNA_ORIENTATION=-